MFIDTSFAKSTSVTTSPLIADEGILLSLKDTALKEAVPLNDASSIVVFPVTPNVPAIVESPATARFLFKLASAPKYKLELTNTFLLNETSPKAACPLKLASFPTNILSENVES